MDLNQCINFLLSKTQNSVLIHFRAKLEKFNVTPVQYSVLKCLWTESDQTPKQLAQETFLDASTITGILDRLENKALIKRVPHPCDHRTTIIELTEEGKALEIGITQAIEDANNEVLADLTLEQQRQLKDALEIVYQRCFELRNK